MNLPAPEERRPGRWRRIGVVLPYALSLLFAIAVAIMASRHEMWRDEIQGWLLARDAATPGEVIRNTSYEGHPWLWHMMLWAPARATHNPAAMQAVHIAVATAAVFLLLRFAPFPLPARILLASGYFFAYEWAVIARNYAPSVLMLFAFCALYARRWRTAPLMGLFLGLACLTNIHAIIVVLAILPAVAIEYAVAYAGDHRDARHHLLSAIAGIILAFTGLVLGIRAANPPPDTGFAVGWRLDWSESHATQTAACVVRAYLPLPHDQPRFWNSNRLIDTAQTGEKHAYHLPQDKYAKSALLLLAVGSLFFLRQPWLLFPYLAGNIGLLAFFYVKYMGSIRHHGFLFLLFCVLMWLSYHIKSWRLPWRWADAPFALWDRARGYLWLPLLGLHVWGTVTAWRQDFRETFSQARDAAAWLRNEFPDTERYLWVGHPSPEVSSVVGYLRLPRIYYVDRNDFGSFVIWDRQRQSRPSESQWLRRVDRMRSDMERDALLVLGNRLSNRAIDSRDIRLLRSFSGSITGEQYFLYHWPLVSLSEH